MGGTRLERAVYCPSLQSAASTTLPCRAPFAARREAIQHCQLFDHDARLSHADVKPSRPNQRGRRGEEIVVLSLVRLKRNYANVTATLALFIALGGGAYAATLPARASGPSS